MSITELVNLTPHPIVVYPGDTPELITAGTVEPLAVIARADGAGPARLACHDRDVTHIAMAGWSLPVMTTEYRTDTVAGLPGPRDGVAYIVSLVVALAAPHRTDLLVPFREVRNLSGTVVGCRALTRPATEAATEPVLPG